MRRSYFLVAIFMSLILFSCQKEDKNLDDVNQGVEFALKSASKFKASDCFSQKADYVNVTIDGVTKKVDVYYVNDKPFTKTIKLSEGEHTLNEFMLMDDNNTPEDDTDDVLVAATPHANSEFAQYVDEPLELNFEVQKFKKTKMPVSVLCYDEVDYSSFGFVFYEIEQVVVREQAFFGDICICRLDDYEQSAYAAQEEGLQLDMPAIAKIEVLRNGVVVDTFSNEANLGEGAPLIVRYKDVLHHEDNFEFKLYILVRQGTTFDYKHFHTWTFKDDETIEAGEDGIVEFVLGNCADEADLVLPPWMNLPPTADYTIVKASSPELGAYVDVKLENIPEGFEIENGLYPSNCADHNTLIHVNKKYSMEVYSSLYPDQLPEFAQSDKWEKFNWLYNNLDRYPGYKWSDIQGFMWLYDDPAWNGQANGTVPAITEITQKMKADADRYGVGYKVPHGGKYVIIFILPGSNQPIVQTMATYLNPCE